MTEEDYIRKHYYDKAETSNSGIPMEMYLGLCTGRLLSRRKEEKKKNEILAKNADTTQKHITAVKHWSPLSSYCSALPDLSMVFFPGMSVSS